MNASRSFDVVVVGGGLAGQLTVLALAARAPSLTVALVERAPSLAGNHTWCCQLSDFLPSEEGRPPSWFLPVVDHRWPHYLVRFPTYERTIEADYLCLRSTSLASASEQALARNGCSLLTKNSVEQVGRDCATLASGEILTGRLVLDARGGELGDYDGRAGYQKFIGWEIEVEQAGAFPSMPVLMDATVAQIDGYRFVYVLPFSSTRFLIEDTYFSRRKDLNPGLARERLREHLAARGIARFEQVREEGGILPMPWAEAERPAGDATAIGYRGGFFHPGTGYSLPRAVLVAERLARLAGSVQSGGLAPAAAESLRALRIAWAADDRFARLLNRLAFRLVPPTRLRDAVFSTVYRLPAPVLSRFYAGRTRLRDRLALAAAPTRIPFLRHAAEQPLLFGENS